MTLKIGPYEHYIRISATTAEQELLAAAGIKGVHHWHRDRAVLNSIHHRSGEIAPGAPIMHCSGTDMRVRGIRKSVVESVEGVRYEIREDLSFGYKILRDGEELSDCDCELSAFIRENHKDFPAHECGHMIEVISTRIVECADIDSGEQLEHWLHGRSIHATTHGESVDTFTSLNDGQCCPDFSCCTGQIAPEETRKAYMKAHREKDHDLKMQLLSGFLGTALNTTLPEEAKVTGKKPYNAYIATGTMAPTGKSN
ncbi:hypothetical protein Xoosp14_38 [Xanthomonas phage Xoo-sp14]|nr:hypothetical protein Xoosp14_38 [Xanthomonas phage Xoo-sp14]